MMVKNSTVQHFSVETRAMRRNLVAGPDTDNSDR